MPKIDYKMMRETKTDFWENEGEIQGKIQTYRLYRLARQLKRLSYRVYKKDKEVLNASR